MSHKIKIRILKLYVLRLTNYILVNNTNLNYYFKNDLVFFPVLLLPETTQSLHFFVLLFLVQ